MCLDFFNQYVCNFKKRCSAVVEGELLFLWSRSGEQGVGFWGFEIYESSRYLN